MRHWPDVICSLNVNFFSNDTGSKMCNFEYITSGLLQDLIDVSYIL